MQKLKTVFKSMFALDLRSLALFRILFGLCLFIDIVYRIPYVYDFYSDEGVLPRAALIENFMNIWEMSLFLANGQTAVITGFMFVTAMSALTFMFGFYTRLSAFVCWILVVSMQTRNGVILHGGDDVFRVLLFWCQFVPLASCYSVDSYLNKTKAIHFTHFSIGSMGLILQCIFIYFFTGVLKIHPTWLLDGTGIYYALQLEQFSSPIGQKLIPYGVLLKWMTHTTLLMELVLPWFVISPISFFRKRNAIVAVFIFFHLGLALTMELGMFPWLCMSLWVIFLNENFWNHVPRWSFNPLFKVAELLKSFGIRSPYPEQKYGIVLQSIAFVFVCLVLAWNIYEVDDLHLKKPTALRKIMSLSVMYQRWSMFAPYPLKDDGWYLIEATQFNGEKIDPFQEDHKIVRDKPKNVARTFKNTMWRKYLTHLWLKDYYKYRVYFGRYLCRTWNVKQQTEDTKINTIYIHYMLERTAPPGEASFEITKELLWSHYCYDKPEGWID